VAMLRRYGEPPVQKFQAWVRRFENGDRRPSLSDHTG
jgi:hypothetical protein